jgi:hypothetical protein
MVVVQGLKGAKMRGLFGACRGPEIHNDPKIPDQMVRRPGLEPGTC